MKRTLSLLLVLFTLGAQSLFAWGKLGHRAVAMIAQRQMKPKTLAKCKELLAGQDLVAIAVWADDIKRGQNGTKARPETSSWHFIDIPVSDTLPDPARYCKNGNCITVKLDYYVGVLKNKQSTKDQKAEALKFVVHLLGDLYQPLHCAMDNDDHGGNAKTVHFEGRKVNLHSLWDHVIAKADDPEGYAQLAKTLEVRDWGDRPVADFSVAALESWSIARAVVYPMYYKTNGVFTDKDDDAKMRAVAERQIWRAGISLAYVLDQAFE